MIKTQEQKVSFTTVMYWVLQSLNSYMIAMKPFHMAVDDYLWSARAPVQPTTSSEKMAAWF